MPDWFEAVQAVRSSLRAQEASVRSVARRLVYFVPDSLPVFELDNVADALLKAQQDLNDAVDAKLAKDLDDARQATGNMLRAVMAGCLVNRDGITPAALSMIKDENFKG